MVAGRVRLPAGARTTNSFTESKEYVMGLWPRSNRFEDARQQPISESSTREAVSNLSAMARASEASGDSQSAATAREALDMELDTLHEIRNLQAHGFKQPKR
jgi:hypothetical protein